MVSSGTVALGTGAGAGAGAARLRRVRVGAGAGAGAGVLGGLVFAARVVNTVHNIEKAGEVAATAAASGACSIQ